MSLFKGHKKRDNKVSDAEIRVRNLQCSNCFVMGC